MNALERIATALEKLVELQNGRRDRITDLPCTVVGCNRKVVARGLCNAHYQRLRLKGELMKDIPITEKGPNRPN
jgi:hypothetical protein